MADTNFSAVNPALEQRIRREVSKQYNRSSLTTDLMPKQAGIGKNLAWDVSVGTATGQVFDDGQIVSTFNADTEILAILPWCEYGDSFKITGLGEDAAASSETQLGQLWVYKLMQARERAAQKVNTDVWLASGTPGPQTIFGLTMASGGPLSATGTYAGIDKAVQTQWQGIVLANGGIPRALSLSLIEYGFELTFNASGRQPTFGVTTSNIWRLLCELAGGERRIMQQVTMRGEQLNISLGFNAVEINGVPVFKDVSVPSGYLAFFREDSIAIEYLPTAPARLARGKIMATVPISGLPQEQVMLGAPTTGGPLIANVIALPSAGNFESWMLDVTIQLKVTRCNAHLLIKDIAFRTE
jgi:hypothetical protein